ncbi:MAG: IS30 family transposase [Gammaproteobacteria bacterium]|nr:IS30 family transposase [Gammaproteobacteria bacterium]NKB62803.1 IS30 family transposase [Gammaproteobacteria bacterium]NKB63220.1 IS30 family transposase [Gammaproteobacteria bacterium]NKB63543.1 IS30 family transposase [Gammaproteobacteria bacterium]NKB64373.1 IS30 family transposase [Gammaproteobacteria bacterium]
MSHYTQLTREQRYQIFALKKVGISQKAIAEEIGVNKSTISRELSRNTGLRGYRPKQAHEFALSRRADKVTPRIEPSHWAEVGRLLSAYWSPEQISWRLYEEQDYRISHEWIYQHVYRDKKMGGKLSGYLRCQKQRKKRYGVYSRRGQIPNQTMIDDRPACVESRSRIGDWEGDTIVGKGHCGVLVSLVDRKSRYTLLGHSSTKEKDPVANEVIRCFKGSADSCHTITYDNGREFSDHERMAKELSADIYFAHPYSSWERGTNENTNGLVRQFYPKTMSLLKVSRQSLQSTMDRLNHRPRKSLNYRTPH